MQESRLDDYRAIAANEKTVWFNLAYLIRTKAKRIALGIKKRKLFMGFRSGNGGKEDETDLSMKHSVQRETGEECGHHIDLDKITLVGVIWGFNKDTAAKERTPIVCPIYFAETSTEEFKLTPEMEKEMGDPRFYDFDKLPASQMPAHVREFLPRLLRGEKLSIFVDMELDYLPTEDLKAPVYLSPTFTEPLPPIFCESEIKQGTLGRENNFPFMTGQDLSGRLAPSRVITRG
jgi:hypothetical protein